MGFKVRTIDTAINEGCFTMEMIFTLCLKSLKELIYLYYQEQATLTGMYEEFRDILGRRIYWFTIYYPILHNETQDRLYINRI